MRISLHSGNHFTRATALRQRANPAEWLGVRHMSREYRKILPRRVKNKISREKLDMKIEDIE